MIKAKFVMLHTHWMADILKISVAILFFHYIQTTILSIIVNAVHTQCTVDPDQMSITNKSFRVCRKKIHTTSDSWLPN